MAGNYMSTSLYLLKVILSAVKLGLKIIMYNFFRIRVWLCDKGEGLEGNGALYELSLGNYNILFKNESLS